MMTIDHNSQARSAPVNRIRPNAARQLYLVHNMRRRGRGSPSVIRCCGATHPASPVHRHTRGRTAAGCPAKEHGGLTRRKAGLLEHCLAEANIKVTADTAHWDRVFRLAFSVRAASLGANLRQNGLALMPREISPIELTPAHAGLAGDAVTTAVDHGGAEQG